MAKDRTDEPEPAGPADEPAHEVDPKPWREVMADAGQITVDVPEG